ncbi:inositol 1,4,5-trisphosphate receptor-interacting protein-like 1 [Cygnus atratus]|uniref:inositol 1,4,5-trisphosphate receptor-interacting protein-like 1 n=1 Tax=Cygnus atratus TaxID=8868 RepID=UPI0021B81698|nr:inositol 1,4,5-trisphosphate receptor-interacting protein-like 1 [Cygnus atratus]
MQFLATFFVLTFLGLIQSPAEVSDELDDATNERMRQYAEELQERMMQLLFEIEEGEKEQSWAHMGALLLSALQNWQFWAYVGVALLYFWSLCRLLRHIPEYESSSEEESSSSDEQQNNERNRVEGRDEGRIFAERIQWPVQNIQVNCRVIQSMVGDLIHFTQRSLTNTFYPVLHSPIGVGSTFEGWSPRDNDTVVYHLLVPMTAPRGHSFHLELGNEEELPSRNSCIRVELECTCVREQDFGNMVCFLHQPEEELRRNAEPSLLQTLCTGSYLDVHKTSYWFQQSMKRAYKFLPESARSHIGVLPSRRSCRLRMIDIFDRTLFVEIMFGVQQDDSAVFLSSQKTEAIFTPDTTWPQSCAVAEMKFFQYIKAHAQQDSFHLRCMQLCARILVGNDFTTYMLKTVVMHLLTTIPLESWRRRDFLQRMDDIMQYLHCCIVEKRLDHFFFGNEGMPEEIILPPDFQTSRPPNLFQHMAQEPTVHARALREFQELRDRLTRLLTFGN